MAIPRLAEPIGVEQKVAITPSPWENHGLKKEEKQIERKIAPAVDLPGGDQQEEEDGVDLMDELFGRLGRSELVQSIIRMMARINGRLPLYDDEGGGGGRENGKRNPADVIVIKDERIERRSAPPKSNEQQRHSLSHQPSSMFLTLPPRSPTLMSSRHDGRQIGEISKSIDTKPFTISKPVEEHQPLSMFLPPRSPTLMGNRQDGRQIGEISKSIDSKPLTISKPVEEHFMPPNRQKENDEMAAFGEAIDKEWKHALFGRSGVLTEIFNFVNDKRKEGLAKQAQMQAAPNVNDKSNDFGKILETLFRKAQTGDFDEPLPEIPFIGICNRLSCADIYKVLDEFRKSEFFSNFQTAISLMNDPKGFDMIGELLANPQLLENFTGPESIGELFGTGKVDGKRVGGGKLVEIGENTDSENIGVDFSELVDGKGTPNGNAAQKPLPAISTSIDSGAPDYYSSVDEKMPSELEKNMDKDKLLPKGNFGSATTKKPKDGFDERPLPEIAESIDARPTLDEEDEFPEGPMTFEKNEFLPLGISNGTRKVVMTPKVEVRLGRERKQPIVGVVGRKTEDSWKNPNGSGAQIGRRTGGDNAPKINIVRNTSTPSSIRTSVRSSTARSTTTTTRRNFRRDDDYYSMYYDNNNEGGNNDG